VVTPPKRFTPSGLDPELIEGLQTIKDKTGEPIAEQVRRALRAWLKRMASRSRRSNRELQPANGSDITACGFKSFAAIPVGVIGALVSPGSAPRNMTRYRLFRSCGASRALLWVARKS